MIIKFKKAFKIFESNSVQNTPNNKIKIYDEVKFVTSTGNKKEYNYGIIVDYSFISGEYLVRCSDSGQTYIAHVKPQLIEKIK